MSGVYDNTLIMYIAGDNGMSAEGGLTGTLNEINAFNGVPDTTANILAHIDDIGGPNSFPHIPVGWALAGDTPFQWTKQVASHYGGTRNGMVISWPAHINDAGGIRTQWHHVIDVTPTILETAGLPQPKFVDGIKQKPIEGVSMVYTFSDAKAPSGVRIPLSPAASRSEKRYLRDAVNATKTEPVTVNPPNKLRLPGSRRSDARIIPTCYRG